MNASAIIFRHEVRAALRTFLWWVVPVGAMVALTCALQPSLAAGALGAKIESMPLTLRKAFGVDIVDFHRPAAYLATNFTLIALTTSLFAALLGAAAIAKEEVLRTAELLFAQPASRTRILLGKVGAVSLYVLAYPAVLAAVALLTLAAVVDRPLEPVIMLGFFIGATATAFCFAGIGILLASLVRDKRAASSAALGVVLGSYFLGIISAIAEPAAPLRWLSPHKLVEATFVLIHGLSVFRVVLLVACGAAAAAVGVLRYRTQDIHA
jgi:ABC-2 type transport system permease protein